jgi:hypothetical protein
MDISGDEPVQRLDLLDLSDHIIVKVLRELTFREMIKFSRISKRFQGISDQAAAGETVLPYDSEQSLFMKLTQSNWVSIISKLKNLEVFEASEVLEDPVQLGRLLAKHCPNIKTFKCEGTFVLTEYVNGLKENGHKISLELIDLKKKWEIKNPEFLMQLMQQNSGIWLSTDDSTLTRLLKLGSEEYTTLLQQRTVSLAVDGMFIRRNIIEIAKYRNIRKIELTGIVTSEILKTVMTSLKNLRELAFTSDMSVFEQIKHVENEILSLKYTDPTHGPDALFHLLEFIEKNGSHLIDLEITCEAERALKLDVLMLLRNNCPKLKSLVLNNFSFRQLELKKKKLIIWSWDQENMLPIFKTFSGIRYFDIRTESDPADLYHSWIQQLEEYAANRFHIIRADIITIFPKERDIVHGSAGNLKYTLLK